MSDILIANTNGNIQRSQDYGANWTTPYSGSRYAISFCDMGSGNILALSKTGYVLRSIDGGQNWSDLGQKITETLYWETEQNSRLVYLGNNSVLTIGGTGASRKVFKSTDSGDNWTTVDVSATIGTEHLICPCPGFVNGECFVSTVSNLMPGIGTTISSKVYRSTDYGSTWILNSGFSAFGAGRIGGRRIKNTSDGYLVGIYWYKSNPSLGYYYGLKSRYVNSTTTWSDTQLNSGAYQSVPPGDAVGAGTGKAIYLAQNSIGGADKAAYSASPYSSWTNMSAPGGIVQDFFYLGSYVFYCAAPGGSQGVYRSSNTGAPSWSQVNATGADELLGFQYSSATADFTGTPTSGSVPLTVSFTDASTGATSWDWDFGDGSSHDNTQNPSHVYSVVGTYTVILSINSGASTKTRTNYITVTAVADFTGTPTVGTANLTVQFTDTSTGATSWNWNFGDGGTSTLQNPSHIYTASGLFTVVLSINSGASVKTRTDYINVSLSADFTGTPVSGSAPLTVQFTDTTQGEHSSWAWDFGDGSTSTLQNPSHVYTLAGTYTVVLSVNGGESIKTRTNYITVSLLADFTGTPVVGAAPLEVQFTDSTLGGPSSWLWDFGDGGTSTLQNPTHIYNVANIYTIILSVNSGASIRTRTNYVTANLTADFEASPTSGDANSVVTFTDTSVGNPTAWLWDFGDAQTSTLRNPTHTYLYAGTYTVVLTVYNGPVDATLTKLYYIHINFVDIVTKFKYINVLAASYTLDISPPEIYQPMYQNGDLLKSFITKGIRVYISAQGDDIESGFKRHFGPTLIFD